MDDERVTQKEWTPDEDKILAAMIEAGAPFSKIGAELNRTRNSCVARANRAGIRHPNIMRTKKFDRVPVFPSLPPPKTPPNEIAPDALFKPLEELNRYTECHYPHGNNPFLFCAAPISRGPYCAFHHKLTHTKWR